MGIDPSTQRDRMVEAIEVILRLFEGRARHAQDPTGSRWSTRRASCCPTPGRIRRSRWRRRSRRRAASSRARHGFGMLCVAATQAGGYDALGINWKVANETAAENGRKMDPEKLRLVGPVHIAETREQAFENVKFGFEKWQDYFGGISGVAGRQGIERPDRSRIWSKKAASRRRHAGRRHRADPSSAGQAGRVRLLPAARAQLGEFREHQEVLRSVAAPRDAGDQQRQHRAREALQLGARQQGTLHRRRHVAPRCRRSRSITKTKRRRRRRRRNKSPVIMGNRRR